MVPATITVVNLILFVQFRSNVYFPVTSVIVSKSYSNTILVILNNRVNIIGGRNEIEPGDHSVSSNWSTHRIGLPWRLRSRREKRDGPAVSTHSGDGIAVLTEVWSDVHNLHTLEVVSVSYPLLLKQGPHIRQSSIIF